MKNLKETYFHIIHRRTEYIVDNKGNIETFDRYGKRQKRNDLMYSEDEPSSQYENFAYLVQYLTEEDGDDQKIEVWYQDCSSEKMDAQFDILIDALMDEQRDIELENEL
jgi:hypothetical protein